VNIVFFLPFFFREREREREREIEREKESERERQTNTHRDRERERERERETITVIARYDDKVRSKVGHKATKIPWSDDDYLKARLR